MLCCAVLGACAAINHHDATPDSTQPPPPTPRPARWKKVVGIEYLQGLVKEAQRYAGKYRGGSSVSFVNKDFIDVDLSDADVVFLYATRCVCLTVRHDTHTHTYTRKAE